jgi:exodeoxyribonuclease V alpha subunit
MVVGELLVAMRDAKLIQPPYKPAGTVKRVELIPLAAVDVERLQPPQVVGLGFDRDDRRLVVLIGQQKALAIAVKGARARRRWSKLRDWLTM